MGLLEIVSEKETSCIGCGRRIRVGDIAYNDDEFNEIWCKRCYDETVAEIEAEEAEEARLYEQEEPDSAFSGDSEAERNTDQEFADYFGTEEDVEEQKIAPSPSPVATSAPKPAVAPKQTVVSKTSSPQPSPQVQSKPSYQPANRGGQSGGYTLGKSQVTQDDLENYPPLGGGVSVNPRAGLNN